MTTSTSTQYPTCESACTTSAEPVIQVRPKQSLLMILKTAGAQGETFTLKEIIHYLGEYIVLKQLYDKQQQHMVYCGGDQLGNLLGRESFSVKDPSPVFDMLKRNVTPASVTDAAQTLVLAKDQSVDNPSQDQLKQSSTERCFSTGNKEDEGDASALATSDYVCREDKEKAVIENLSKEQTSLDLGLEEWDIPGLPWWFLGNLRSNKKSRSNGSTDIHTNQDVDTVVVSDTTDDFLNETASDQLGVTIQAKGINCEQVDNDGKESSKTVSEVACSSDFEDSQSLSDDTDIDVPTEDSWQCTKCKKFNCPSERYCFRCWALRKDWFSDCPKLAHSLSTSSIDRIQSKEDTEGMDVPDCRRTVSAPVGRSRDPCQSEAKCSQSPKSSLESLPLGRCKEREEEELLSLESSKELLKPCLVCQKRPRNGNIVHGRTAHLVVCFKCARMLKKMRTPCPLCKKQIQLVIKTYLA
ncbi:hypothetical protein JRQ81_015197 [Phrynocephalus forsythii]|uniref:Protein Mdm4 n=1 Tax=Phrynocephalus forsythii TaxID=171643 RepID=A0A9Q1B3J0_9SAUR|nr:hypothetical protein JRQ81_015197 [Phrynocephalus forsythii]